MVRGLDPLDRIFASVACHAAIKINMKLDQTKMEWLLGALAETDCPMSCPHKTPLKIETLIFRERRKHKTWGPKKLRDLLD